MLPSSLLNVLSVSIFLAPGLVFVLRKERRVPASQVSVFRDTLRIVFVSLASFSAVGLMFAILSLIRPSITPDIGALVRAPSAYASGHYASIAYWSLGLVGLAVLFAAVAADSRLARRAKKISQKFILRGLLDGDVGYIRQESAWYKTIHAYDDKPGSIYIGASLSDGTYIGGYLTSFSVTPEESGDRDLVLQEPLTLRTTDGAEHKLQSQFTVISARNLSRLDITHIDPSAGLQQPTTQQGTPDVTPA